MPVKPDRSLEILGKAAPALFVVLWSTGFIGNKYALPHVEPFTFVGIRLLLAALLMAAIGLVLRAPLPRGAAARHNIISGILVHGIYLIGVASAMARGMPAGIAALMVGLQPILTSTLANRLLGERVYPEQWIGLLLGFAGVWLVVQGKAGGETSIIGWISVIMALLGITLGTLYQKKFGGGVNFVSAMPVQYAAAAALAGAGAFLFETRTVEWVPEFYLSVLWLILVLSCGAVLLLYMLIRSSAATRVASLFYLTPPVTALMSFVLFSETLGAAALVGMVLCVAGVFLVNWRAAPTA